MPGNDQGQPLAGTCIWVTRPQHQSQPLVASLAALGAQTLSMPLLAIEAFENPAAEARLQQLSAYQLVIFVSANAVEFSAKHMTKCGSLPEIATIGAATAAKCRENGLNVAYFPQQADSEGLLALPRFQALQGQRVLIVRGVGGRAYLGEQLRQRGAQIEYAEVYQRRLPDIRLQPDFARADIIALTSSEALAHLASLARRDQQTWVFNKQLLLIHPRIAGRAGELGFTLKPLVARQPNDVEMVAALVDWAQSQRSK